MTTFLFLFFSQVFLLRNTVILWYYKFIAQGPDQGICYRAVIIALFKYMRSGASFRDFVIIFIQRPYFCILLPCLLCARKRLIQGLCFWILLCYILLISPAILRNAQGTVAFKFAPFFLKKKKIIFRSCVRLETRRSGF